MTHHALTPPITEAQARALRVNDTVTLEGPLFGIRDANQIALFDKGRKTRFDLRGHAAIHTAPNVRKVAVSPEHPTGYAPVCVGTTTSARMERFTSPLVEGLGVRLIIGKGGLAQARSRSSRVPAPRISRSSAARPPWRRPGSRRSRDVDLDDLNPESIWKFRVKGFGPLLVAMDSHGASLYEAVDREARARREKTLSRLGVK
jgi:L(+)-tartrate dehydratase beta subunit